MLDGFLTSIVSGPEPIPPGEWLLRVWSQNPRDKDTPAFKDAGQAERGRDLVLRRLDSIAFTLLNSPGEFEPVLYVAADASEGHPLAARWCLGYVIAMDLRKDAWWPLTTREEYVDVIKPILTLAAAETDAELGDALRDPVRRSSLVGLLPACAVRIHTFWRAQREGRTLPRQSTDKVRRNDPCPCGSGRKFKHCCGRLGARQ